jgi:hypothetical protein
VITMSWPSCSTNAIRFDFNSGPLSSEICM